MYLMRMRHCGTVLLQSSSLEGMACLISNMSMCLLLVSYLETSYGLIRSLHFAFEPSSLSISPHSRCSLTPKTVRSPQSCAIFLPFIFECFKVFRRKGSMVSVSGFSILVSVYQELASTFVQSRCPLNVHACTPFSGLIPISLCHRRGPSQW